MICKGNTNDGAKLADYLANGKEGERAEVWDLRGFGATNIKDAFRDVQIMAGATKCSKPFFHVQVRNRDGEVLTREQFEYAADRIEKMLGLTGQPRAIAFHTYEESGHEHMHVAWSRIDEETLTAKPLPYFKSRLKKISRELELHFSLEPVTNQREGNIKYAPTKAQEEQARRLGIDIHEVRNAIRNCWDRSDCGTSFQAALDHEGLTLAQGERRDFVVIDRAGGIHALGKRILDMTAAKIRDRLSNIERDALPTIAMVRTSLLEAVREEVKELERTEPHWDRDLADRTWQDAVLKEAIEKEKAERQFVEPKERESRAGDRTAQASSKEREWPVMPPVPEPIRTAPEFHFEDAARATTRNRTYEPPTELRGMSKQIMEWLQTFRNDTELISRETKTLSAALEENRIALARVTKDEAERSHREAEFAKSVGRYALRFTEGEIVAVREPTLEFRRNGELNGPAPRVHKLDQFAASKFVAELDRPDMVKGVEATKQELNERARQRAVEREAMQSERATKIGDFSRIIRKSGREAKRLNKTGLGIGRGINSVADAILSLFAVPLTPEQKREGERATYRREADAENAMDLSRYTEELAQQRQSRENEQEAERRQHRERDGGGRER